MINDIVTKLKRWHWTKTGMVQGDARYSYYGVHAVKMVVAESEHMLNQRNTKIKRLEKVIENGIDDCGYTRELHDLTHDQSQKIREHEAIITNLNDKICGINFKTKKRHEWVFQMCPNCGNKVEYWEDTEGYKIECGKCQHRFWKGSQKIEKEAEEIDWERIKEACNPKLVTVGHIPAICQAILSLRKRVEFEAGLIDAIRFGSDMK